MLVILDGWGWREDTTGNAVQLADTPVFDALMEGPHAFLRTSGLDVGLPPGQMGNSEVGHLNIGAGRVVMQELPRIGQAIQDGSMATNPALTAFIADLRQSGGTCHLLGLLSPGGVHAHQDHALSRPPCPQARALPPSAGVITPWTATIAGTGWSAPMRRLQPAPASPLPTRPA